MGGIHVEQPWGQDLGQALGSLVNTFHNFQNPDFEFKRRLEHELITNPELVQHLADLEHQSPGVVSQNMGHLISPASARILGSARPTLEARIARTLSEHTGEAITPEIARNSIRQKLTGQNEAQRAITGAQAQSVGQFGQQAVTEGGKDMATDLIDPLGQKISSATEIANARTQFQQLMAQGRTADAWARLRAGFANQRAMLGDRADTEQGQTNAFDIFWSERIPGLAPEVITSYRTGAMDGTQRKALQQQMIRVTAAQVNPRITSGLTQLRIAANTYRAAKSRGERETAIIQANEALRMVNDARAQAFLPPVQMSAGTQGGMSVGRWDISNPNLVYRSGDSILSIDQITEKAAPKDSDYATAIDHLQNFEGQNVTGAGNANPNPRAPARQSNQGGGNSSTLDAAAQRRVTEIVRRIRVAKVLTAEQVAGDPRIPQAEKDAIANALRTNP